MDVLFVATEAVPYIKTGGLGEVVGTLSQEMRRRGMNARVIIPCYSDIPSDYRKKLQRLTAFPVQVGWRQQDCSIFFGEEDGLPVYFVDNEYYFQRPGLYGHSDDGERFAFFCRAVLEALPSIPFQPHLIHCHDWQTAMICTLLKTTYKNQPFYENMKTLYTVHNLKYQGIFPKEALNELWNISWDHFTPDRLEFFDQLNYMKGGLIYADAISTVSRTYAGEIMTPAYGEKLDGVIRARQPLVYGIRNGIDDRRYNPARDPDLIVNYDWTDWEKKRQNKEGLQEQFGLTIQGDKPMIAMVTRLAEPKGIRLVAAVLYELLIEDIQLVVLGSGEEQYEHVFQVAAWLYPEKVAFRSSFDDRLARHLFAAADLLLMPSLYEPCGLSQLFSMRYGCLPLVRETGGLKETVVPYNEYTGEGNGFSFAGSDAKDMLHALGYALHIYHEDKSGWARLVENAMQSDYSWRSASSEYCALYSKLTGEGEKACL